MKDRVLIVEDDDDLRDLVRTVVEREGMETIEAADGREGLRQFYDQRPALVILDLGLPEMNGWQVLERIRELGDVPVLILTAASAELDKVRGLREGADDYVTKPFGRQELIARIEALLRRAGPSEIGEEVVSDGLVEIDFTQRREGGPARTRLYFTTPASRSSSTSATCDASSPTPRRPIPSRRFAGSATGTGPSHRFLSAA